MNNKDVIWLHLHHYKHTKEMESQFESLKILPIRDQDGVMQNRIIVEPAEDDVVQNGIIIANPAQITCRVKAVCEKSYYKRGQLIQVRNRKEFQTIIHEGKEYIVLEEREVVGAHLKPGEYTIIVKIDVRKRDALQEKTESGIYLPQGELWQKMKYNLQYGEVVEVGAKALERYPMAEVGKTIIFYHTVESENHRLIRTDLEPKDPDNPKSTKVRAYEYRILYTAPKHSREVLGGYDPATGNIIPSEKHLFLDYKFEMFGLRPEYADEDKKLCVAEFQLQDCYDLDSLRNRLDYYRKTRVEKSKLITQMLTDNISKLNPNVNRHRDMADNIDTKLEQTKAEVQRQADFLNKNHLVVCATLFAYKEMYEDWEIMMQEKLVFPYKILYPLRLDGRQFLVAEIKHAVALVP